MAATSSPLFEKWYVIRGYLAHLVVDGTRLLLPAFAAMIYKIRVASSSRGASFWKSALSSLRADLRMVVLPVIIAVSLLYSVYSGALYFDAAWFLDHYWVLALLDAVGLALLSLHVNIVGVPLSLRMLPSFWTSTRISGGKAVWIGLKATIAASLLVLFLVFLPAGMVGDVVLVRCDSSMVGYVPPKPWNIRVLEDMLTLTLGRIAAAVVWVAVYMALLLRWMRGGR